MDKIFGGLIFALLALGGIGVIAYFIARYLRGNISISVPGTVFRNGDLIKGSLVVKTRKAIQANRLLVALVGYVVVEGRRSDGKFDKRKHEVYRDERTLECRSQYPEGCVEEIDFELVVPTKQSEDWKNGLSLVVELMNSRHEHEEWEIQVRLDAVGIDLGASRRIYVQA